MWHLNRDSLIAFSGERFNIEFGDLTGVLVRVYVKDFKNCESRIRVEKQQRPYREYGKLIDKMLKEGMGD